MQTSFYGDDEPRSIFVFGNPLRFLSRKGRTIGAYLSGGLLTIGWWIFIDAVINSAKYNEHSLGFEDWFSGILTTLGMIVINLIDKNRLQGEAFSYAGSGLVWKARLFLFLGFALIAGGLAGSCCVLIVKYIIHLDSSQPYINYGVAEVAQNALIMLSTVVLWVAQNTQEEYEYNLHL
ncbi:hypothetical protein G6F45_002639 [Rhizopus arrhizus]|uniref:Uncharacterized protein n=3 Tax=Rhizopus TaxID=4842 RepID=I1BGY2_RHIO9|nr:hypothetical protein RO3G_00166 [Rhizopus delemar RA 99-880]KAG1056010.1 hypothetical protein G6F43_002061 [Rhizopus delemar]KAG1150240.1 hypothetical protein G6F38_002183 [Rhizopus arrhizus]KAG1155356.1 hypothetical protein G6F37_008611 [Rhizopus arrhizus]KAG1634581.1 hypothetical protein G6F45_002639 [Rhizopus arrhizus]|eukprot:EIE75462.1 hypothetical protein RO3G_00166 [Rhizopus delemar RA 99-880]